MEERWTAECGSRSAITQRLRAPMMTTGPGRRWRRILRSIADRADQVGDLSSLGAKVPTISNGNTCGTLALGTGSYDVANGVML